ncbi:MAG: hypothetical protein FH751_14410 [Firmicutes bacterium]|nr:hypothetical protein [Bacillota bacterium]
MRKGYKKTKLGIIPEEWQIRQLDKISTLITKGSTPTTYGFDYVKQGINFVKIENLDDNGKLNSESFLKITRECHEKLSRSKLKENDILVSIAGSLGKSTIVSNEILPANTNQALAIIRIKENEFLITYINRMFETEYFRKYIKRISTVGAQPNLSLKQIGEYKFPVPSLKEQKEIASILSSVDEHIEEVDYMIEDLKELKKGLMQKLLTGQYTIKNGKLVKTKEFKKTRLGMVPKSWEVKKIEKIADTTSGGTPKRNNKKYYINGKIPWIKTGELTQKYIWNTEEYITDLAVKESSAKLIPKDTVLVAMYGATIGKASILSIQATANQACCAILAKKHIINNEYLYYQLAFNRYRLISLSAGGAQPNISQQIIKKFEILIPNIEEQEKIASILSSVDERIETYKKEKEDLQQLKKGLTQQLLTGKIRVKA